MPSESRGGARVFVLRIGCSLPFGLDARRITQAGIGVKPENTVPSRAKFFLWPACKRCKPHRDSDDSSGQSRVRNVHSPRVSSACSVDVLRRTSTTRDRRCRIRSDEDARLKNLRPIGDSRSQTNAKNELWQRSQTKSTCRCSRTAFGAPPRLAPLFRKSARNALAKEPTHDIYMRSSVLAYMIERV